MANPEHDREESMGSQQNDHFINLERRRDRKHNPTPSVRVETLYTGQTYKSHSRIGGHASHE